MKRKPKPIGHPYRCIHCGKIVYRESDKAWIASHCQSHGEKLAHLQWVKT